MPRPQVLAVCNFAPPHPNSPEGYEYIGAVVMTDQTPDQTPQAEASAEKPARRGLFRKRTPAPTPDSTTPEVVVTEVEVTEVVVEDAGDEAGDRTRPGVLRRRRRKLLGQYEQGIFDLGGLALELHRRGLLAEEVMRRKAAEVTDLRGQVDQVDERLGEIRSERSERRQSGRGASRTCPACGARCKATANFCAECGTPLKAPDAEGGAADDPPTIVIADATTQDTQVISTGDAQPTEAFPPVKVDE